MPNMYIYNAKKSMNLEQNSKLAGSKMDSRQGINDRYLSKSMIVEDDASGQVLDDQIESPRLSTTTNPYLFSKGRSSLSIDTPKMVSTVHDSDGTDTSSCDNSVNDGMAERISVISNNSDNDDYSESNVVTPATGAMKIPSSSKKGGDSEGNFNDYSNIYIRSSKKTAQKKRKRTNYKDPKNAEKLQNALNVMLCRSNIDMRQLLGKSYVDDDGNEIRKTLDLKTVSKLFDVPYNTLRDNYLKITQGSVIVKESTRARKLEMEAQQRGQEVKAPIKATPSKETSALIEEKKSYHVEEVETQLNKRLKSNHSSSPAVKPVDTPAAAPSTASVPIVPTPTIPGLTPAQSAQVFAQEEARTSLMSLAVMQNRLLQTALLSANPNAVPPNFPAGTPNPLMMNPFLNPATVDKSMQSLWYPALFPWSMFTSFPQLASYPVASYVMPQANMPNTAKKPSNKKTKVSKRTYNEMHSNDCIDAMNSTVTMDPNMNEPASILASLGSTNFNFGHTLTQQSDGQGGNNDSDPSSPLLGIINGATVTA